MAAFHVTRPSPRNKYPQKQREVEPAGGGRIEQVPAERVHQRRVVALPNVRTFDALAARRSRRANAVTTAATNARDMDQAYCGSTVPRRRSAAWSRSLIGQAQTLPRSAPYRRDVPTSPTAAHSNAYLDKILAALAEEP